MDNSTTGPERSRGLDSQNLKKSLSGEAIDKTKLQKNKCRSQVEELYFKFKDDVRRWVTTRVKDKVERDDVCQNVWENVSRYMYTYSEKDGLGVKSWLFRITDNAIKRNGRRIQRRNEHTCSVPDHTTIEQLSIVDTAIEEKTDQQLLLEHLSHHLSSGDLEILKLRLKGFTYEQIGLKLGKTTTAVKVQFFRIRKRYQTILTDGDT